MEFTVSNDAKISPIRAPDPALQPAIDTYTKQWADVAYCVFWSCRITYVFKD